VRTLAIRLDPQLLDNPDADIRYRLPDILAEPSGGVISDDGYDYVGTQPLMVVFLKVSQLNLALVCHRCNRECAGSWLPASTWGRGRDGGRCRLGGGLPAGVYRAIYARIAW
jgi:hypothetical protein